MPTYAYHEIVSIHRTAGGFLLVLVGIAGLILPVMPGWIFLIPGLALLAERFHWARRLVAWAKEKSKVSPLQ